MVNIYCYKDAQPLELLGVVDDFISFSFQRSYSGIGSWQLTLNADSLNAQRIKDMKYIRVSEKVAGYVVKHVEKEEDNAHTITYTGYELKVIAARRIIVPPTGYAYLTYSNVAPEYVIARLLDTQLINPTSANREIAGSIAPYVTGADTISYNGRFQNVGTEIETIATANYIGWAADIEDGAIVWKIWRGTDRTEGQSTNDRMIVSYDYDTMQNSNIEVANEVPNYVLVAGQGEGIDRQLETIDYDAAGIERNEIYVDARDIPEEGGSAPLIQRGKEKLAEYGSQTVYNATFSQSFNDRYRSNYELGDIGTVKDSKILNGQMDFYLTIIEEVYEGAQFILNATFGYDKNTLSDAIQRINSKSDSLIASEGSGGISGIVAINQGGTGADNAAQALTNLGAAAANHNHSGVYAPVSHNHDTLYATIGHNHNTLYSQIGHTHDYLPLAGGSMGGRIAGIRGTYVADANSRYASSALEIRENNLVTTTQSDIGYAPSIGFHWGGRAAGTLVMTSSGEFSFLSQSGGYQTLRTGYHYVHANTKYLMIGPQNTAFSHYTTDADTGHWFNKAVYVAGDIYAGASYNMRVYHAGNITYGTGTPSGGSSGNIYFQYV